MDRTKISITGKILTSLIISHTDPKGGGKIQKAVSMEDDGGIY